MKHDTRALVVSRMYQLGKNQLKMDATKFDQKYYQRYYYNRHTRVTERQQAERLARLVCAFMAYHNVPVKRVLDLGCGLGYWEPVILKHYAGAKWTGVEISEYLCAQLGWVNGSIVDYRPRGRFDLVVCQDVLQYLNPTEAQVAIDRLGQWCRGVLYFDALTQEDWDNNVDQSRTDGDVFLRRAAWYRSRLTEQFISVGAGLHLHRDADTVLFELEKA